MNTITIVFLVAILLVIVAFILAPPFVIWNPSHQLWFLTQAKDRSQTTPLMKEHAVINPFTTEIEVLPLHIIPVETKLTDPQWDQTLDLTALVQINPHAPSLRTEQDHPLRGFGAEAISNQAREVLREATQEALNDAGASPLDDLLTFEMEALPVVDERLRSQLGLLVVDTFITGVHPTSHRLA